MAEVNLSCLDTNWHALKLAFRGNRIAVYLDGNQVAAVTDNNFDGVPAYTNGGIGLHMFMSSAFVATFDNVLVSPLVTDDSYGVNENTNLTVVAPGVLGNDTAVYGSNLVAILVSGPTNGTVNLNTNGGFTYTQALNYVGTDSFTYQANDGQTNLGVATATITVNPGTFIVRPTILSLTGARTTNVVITWSAVSNVFTVCNISPILAAPTGWICRQDVTATNTTASAVDNPDGATRGFIASRLCRDHCPLTAHRR